MSARHWQDIRRAARLSRIEGVTLITHGVTSTPAGIMNEQENRSLNCMVEKATPARDGCRSHKPSESVGNGAQTPSKKQQRDAQRAQEHQDALRCGSRWLPLVQTILRRARAKTRDDVWTEWMRTKLALREKMRGLLRRAWAHDAQQRALAIAEATAAKDTCTLERSISTAPEALSDDEKSTADAMADAWRAALESSPAPSARKSRGRRSRAKRP